MKVGVIGNGKLGSIVVDAIKEGLAPDCELVGVASRSLGVTPMDLISLGAEVIVEAAKPEVLKEYLIPILEKGVSVIPLSTGALSDSEYLQQVKEAAKKSGAKVHLPHGAMGAFDLASTFALRPEMSGTVVFSHFPSMPGAPASPFAAIPKDFHGTALEGFALTPSHLNVVIETAIACGGFENTSFDGREAVNGKGGFSLELENDCSKAVLQISNKPPKPGTSPMTMIALSAVSTLNRITSPITF